MSHSVAAYFMGHTRPVGGCEIYRIVMPFNHIQKRGWKTAWAFADTIEREHGWRSWQVIAQSSDIVIFPRLYIRDGMDAKNAIDMIDFIHAAGKRVVYEVDDDMTNEHRHVADGDTTSILNFVDAVTVSTEPLKQIIRRYTDVPIYVLPNALDMDLWGAKPAGKLRAMFPDKILIALTGSPTHYDDWKVLETVLPRIADDERIHIIFGGFKPDYFDGLPNSTFIEPLPYVDYAFMLKDADIILAPVNDDPFNMGKSGLKAMEGQGAMRFSDYDKVGAAVVASDHPIYQAQIKDGETGLLASSADEWYECIFALIEHPEMRHQLGRAAYKNVLQRHTIQSRSLLWHNAYSDILKLPLPKQNFLVS